MAKRRKTEFPMNANQQNFMFEVAQEIGLEGKKQPVPGLKAPLTGADALTKTDHGSFAKFNLGSNYFS